MQPFQLVRPKRILSGIARVDEALDALRQNVSKLWEAIPKRITHGGYYFHPGDTVFVFATSPTMKLANATTSLALNGIEHCQANRLCYRDDHTEHLIFNISLSASSSAARTTFHIHLYRNGALVAGSTRETLMVTANEINTLATCGIVEAKPGDTFEVWGETDKNATITIAHCTFVMHE